MRNVLQPTLTLTTIILLISTACQKTEYNIINSGDGESYIVDVTKESVIEGVLAVKLKSEPESLEQVQMLFSNLPVTSVKRMFVGPEKFEARKRECGLSRWYLVEYDQSQVPLTRAAIDISIPEAEIVEYVPRIRSNSASKFNDPHFTKQWNFYNDGSIAHCIAGSDINVLKAWEVTTGDPDVIVAIIDDAVDYDHPDLADNVWVNSAELNGVEGVDDDGNGYVDDIYGFNFMSRNINEFPGMGYLIPGDHGTHVAGVIAAVNNNKTGVSGIAGGDGSRNGVKLMSCQISGLENVGAYANLAFAYAADNGAVIAQCSWETDRSASAISESIKYFINYAGKDQLGRQVGPLNGGIAIFAAGNSSTTSAFPADQDYVVAVAALGPNYKKTSYSNYGSWVTVSAPGGDEDLEIPIYSTITVNNGSYGVMSGTSMACPHVTGIAALVISEYKDQGLTPEQLKKILKNGTKNIDSYNPQYVGMLGGGLIDAQKCLSLYSPLPPETITNAALTAKKNTITLSVEIPSDPDSGVPNTIWALYSLDDLSAVEINSIGSNVAAVEIPVGSAVAGDMVQTEITGLNYGATYYFRFYAEDLVGSLSALSNQFTVTTEDDSAPEIIALDGTSVTLAKHEVKTLSFRGRDDDKMSARLIDAPSELSLLQENDSTWVVTIIGRNAPAAESAQSYNAVIAISDGVLESTLSFEYTVLPNSAPVSVEQIPYIIIGVGENATISLPEYFKDENEGDIITYSATTSSENIGATISGELLTINGIGQSNGTVTVTATDYNGATAISTFNVLIRGNSGAIDLYPNPVYDILKVRPVSDTNIAVVIYSVSGTVVASAQGTNYSPFAPLEMNLSSLSAGVYKVVVSYVENGAVKEYTSQIVKR